MFTEKKWNVNWTQNSDKENDDNTVTIKRLPGSGRRQLDNLVN